MLSILDTRADRNCQGLTRRELLRIGALGFGGGLSLPSLLASRAAAASTRVLSDKSVVLLFLHGGPSHIELFDPKPAAPIEFRSITGEVSTSLPGITFGGTFGQMGQMAHKLAIVRSYGSRNAGHSYEVVNGGNKLKASMGSLYARVAGVNHPANGMPRNILVLPEAVSPGLKLGSNFETSALPTLTDPGVLGANLRAFNPSAGGDLQQSMELRIPGERLDDRRALLERLDRVRRDADESGLFEAADRYTQQAFDVITGGVAEAFDLTREDPRTLARYDTSHLFTNEQSQRWFDMKRSTNLLGKQMLLARRLCEAGCGFVSVSDCGWDMHSNGNSPKNLGAMSWLGPQVDHAVAAFVQDLEERGLTDKILLVITGEMGRTPRINNNGGRDHYGNLTPLCFAGGGLRMGQVIGQSDAKATEPATRPYAPQNLLATVLHTLFDVGQLRLTRGIPSELLRAASEEEPIAELFS